MIQHNAVVIVGHVGKLRAAIDITYSEDAVDVGPEVGVDKHLPTRACFDARLFKAEPVGGRASADGKKCGVGEEVAVFERDGEVTAESGEFSVVEESNSAGLQIGFGQLRYFPVEIFSGNSPRSMMVTLEPCPLKSVANSKPMGPPPMIARCFGRGEMC